MISTIDVELPPASVEMAQAILLKWNPEPYLAQYLNNTGTLRFTKTGMEMFVDRLDREQPYLCDLMIKSILEAIEQKMVMAECDAEAEVWAYEPNWILASIPGQALHFSTNQQSTPIFYIQGAADPAVVSAQARYHFHAHPTADRFFISVSGAGHFAIAAGRPIDTQFWERFKAVTTAKIDSSNSWKIHRWHLVRSTLASFESFFLSIAGEIRTLPNSKNPEIKMGRVPDDCTPNPSIL